MRAISKFGWGFIALSIVLSIWIIFGGTSRADGFVDGIRLDATGTILEAYDGTTTDIVIPSTVKTINTGAFSNSPNLLSVTPEGETPSIGSIVIPGHVTTIQDNAFSNCECINSVTLSEGVLTVGAAAFRGCANLVGISLPSTLETLGADAITGTGITTITIPKNCTTFLSGISGDLSLVSVTVDPGNSQYSSVIAPNGNGLVYNKAGTNLVMVPKGSVSGNSGTSVADAFQLPASTKSIDTNALNRCAYIREIYIPSSVEQINDQGDFVPNIIWGDNFGSEAHTFAGLLQAQGDLVTFKSTQKNPDGSYTITFDTNGGTPVPETQNVLPGGKVTKPTSPSKPGYLFSNWYTSKDITSTSVPYDFESPVYGGFTLYAGYTTEPTPPPTTEIPVRFYYNNTLIDTKYVQSGSVVTPTTKGPSGVTITWYKDSNFTTQFNFNTPITVETNLYGKGNAIVPKYWVTFNANGGTIDGATSKQIEYTSGDTALPGADRVVRSGYTFGGWYTDDACTVPYTAVTGTVTVYAKWTQSTTTGPYTVTFYMNDGTGATFGSYPSINAGTTIAEPAQKPTRTGYTFSGWYTTSACTQGTAFNFGYTTINANTSLYAKWIATGTAKYTVVLTLNGGTLNGYTGSATYMLDPMTNVSTIPSPTRQGYVFAGWYKDSACTIPATTITENTTLYAKWTDGSSDPNTCTITFNSNGGSSVASIKVSKYGYITRALETPTKAGYRFTGWYTDPTCINLFSPSQQITTSMTLYAGWIIDGSWIPGNGNGTGSGTGTGNNNVNVNGNNNNVTYQVNSDGTVTKTQVKDNTPKTADNFDERWLLCLAMFMVGIAAVLLSSRNRAKLILEKVNSRK